MIWAHFFRYFLISWPKFRMLKASRGHGITSIDTVSWNISVYTSASLIDIYYLNQQMDQRMERYNSPLKLGDGRVITSHIKHVWSLNTLRPRQNRRRFTDDVLKCIFLNENVWITIEISLKCVPKGPIDNIPSLVQIMAWRRPGDKPLSEPLMVRLPTHICVTRPQWVNHGII